MLGLSAIKGSAASLLVVVSSPLDVSTETTSAAGSNETDLLTSGCVATHSGSVTNVLVVTTTVGMLHRVHGHTTDLGPGVALGLVLVVGVSGLEEGLVHTTSTSDHTDHGAAVGVDDLLGARRELDASLAGVRVLADDGGVVARGAGELATVSGLTLHVADNGTLRHLSDGKHVAHVKGGCDRQNLIPPQTQAKIMPSGQNCK